MMVERKKDLLKVTLCCNSPIKIIKSKLILDTQENGMEQFGQQQAPPNGAQIEPKKVPLKLVGIK